MPARRPIADGYLDDVFAPERVEERTAEPPLFAMPDELAPTRSRQKATGRTGGKRKRSTRRSSGAADRGGVGGITLQERQLDFVDSIVQGIEDSGVHKANRQQVVGALLDALAETRLEFSQVDSLAALRQAVVHGLPSLSLLQVPGALLDASLKAIESIRGAFGLGRDRSQAR